MTAIVLGTNVSHETQINYKIYNLFGINKEYIISMCHNGINNAKYNNMRSILNTYGPYMRYITSRHMGQYMPYTTIYNMMTSISHIGHMWSISWTHNMSHIVNIVHIPHIVHILRQHISNMWTYLRVPNLKIKLKIKFLLSHINISNRNRK